MKIDVQKIRPSSLVRMLNSTPLGSVINERDLREHRNNAGFRVGDDRSVNLIRYCAWLAARRHEGEQKERTPRTLKALAERLGIPLRTLHRYRNLPDWPETIPGQERFVQAKRGGQIRGRGAASAKLSAGGDVMSLTERKLEQEILKLELANESKTEEIITREIEKLRAEAARYFDLLSDGAREWADKYKITPAARRDFNELLGECMAAIKNEAE